VAAQETIDDKVALGVLLHEVAKADRRWHESEKDKIRQVLRDFAHIPEDDIVSVLGAVERAERASIDFYAFTHQFSRGVPYAKKKNILENLFRVACADGDLAQPEHEVIRKIAGLLLLDHKDFIDAKIKVKKEFGMDTAGL